MKDLVRISFDLWSALLAFGIFQGLLLTLVLLGFQRNRSLYALMGLVLILVLNLFNQLLFSTNLATEFPHLVYVFTPLLFLVGPLYQWHIKAAVVPGYRPGRVVLHLLPFALGVLLLSSFYLQDAETKVVLISEYLQSDIVPISFETMAFMSLQIIQTLGYIYLTRQWLRKSDSAIKSKRSKQGLQWLSKFSLAFTFYWTVDFVALGFYSFYGAIHQQVFYATMLGAALFINVLVVFMIRHHQAFNLLVLSGWGKYRNSQLSNAEKERMLNRMMAVMGEEKPYLDAELSLAKFASLIGRTPHQVSEVLNSSLGKSFYEFINEYRYQEARERLQDQRYRHLTILAIAFDAGFSNKNTFNKVFKQHSGKTPSQFLKEVSGSLA